MLELQRKQAIEKREKLEFEFIEAPKKTHPKAPKKSVKKISDRDALNQDLTKNKSKAEELPAIKNVELADQLAQRQFQPPKSPALESEPQPAVKKSESAPEKEIDHTEKKPESEEMLNAKPPEETLTPRAAAEIPENILPKPQSEAQPPIQGLTGQDKITTQEMARHKSSGAKLDGLTSFEATGSGMGVYMKNLKEKIWLAWYPYLAFKYPQDYRGASALVSILLDKKGDVKIVRVLEERGSPVFAAFCMESIQRASGFGALPEEILALVGKDELELKFRFRYY